MRGRSMLLRTCSMLLLLLYPAQTLAEGAGWLRLEIDEPDATVEIDGEVQPEAARAGEPILVELPPGDHVVIVSKDGLAPKTRAFTIAENEVTQVDVLLHSVRWADSDTPAFGKITVTSTPPGAVIEIDGRTLGELTTPATVEGVPPGRHEVAAELTGSRKRKTVEVRADETTLVELNVGHRTTGVAPVPSLEEGVREPRTKFRVGNFAAFNECFVTGEQIAGERVGTTGAFVLGLGLGVGLGLIGTFIAYAASGGHPTPPPSYTRDLSGDCLYGFNEGYATKGRGKKKTMAAVGGFIGTAIAVGIVMAQSSN